jgi:hypothetical protein
MRADADQHAEFRLDRAMPVGGIGRLLQFLRVRICEQRQQFPVAHRTENLRRAVKDEDRPFAPADDHLLAGRDLAAGSPGPPLALRRRTAPLASGSARARQLRQLGRFDGTADAPFGLPHRG